MKPGARYVLAAVLVCPMQIDWTQHSYTETHRVVVCAQSWRVVKGVTVIETKGDGVFRAGFER